MVKARFFSIITARGHSADNLQKNIEYLSNATLSQEEQDEQADNVRKLWDRRFSYPPFHNQEMLHWFFTEIGSYYPVGNPHIYRGNLHAINISSAERKTLAMKQSIQHTRHMVSHVLWICHNAIPLNIGFSDDSLHNIRAMKAFFEHHAKHEKLISSKDKIRLYHTGHDAPQTIKI